MKRERVIIYMGRADARYHVHRGVDSRFSRMVHPKLKSEPTMDLMCAYSSLDVGSSHVKNMQQVRSLYVKNTYT